MKLARTGAALVMGLAVLTGCSSSVSHGGAKTAKTEITPMDELRAIPRDLDGEIAALTKPIDEVQLVIDDMTSIPKRHGISAGDMIAMSKVAFESGSVQFKLAGDTEVSAEAQREVETCLQRLASVSKALKATPSRVLSLTKRIFVSSAQLPLLAGRVTTQATMVVANPFGNAEEKAKARADLEGVTQVRADVTRSLGEAEAKIVGIPAMATGALGKLGASFASVN